MATPDPPLTLNGLTIAEAVERELRRERLCQTVRAPRGAARSGDRRARGQVIDMLEWLKRDLAKKKGRE